MAVELHDHEARQRMVSDLDSSVFVEAGAGTGKTSVMVDRFVATVVEDGVPVRNVAAITFTDKAAGELRGRLREAFAERSRREGHSERPGRDRAWLAGQTRDIDTAPIGTIHSFALSLLRQHCLAAGLPIGFEVADEETLAEQKRDRWRAVHDRWAADLSAPSQAALALAGIRLIELKDLVESLDANRARLAAQDVQWAFRNDPQATLVGVASGLRSWVEATLAECADPSDKLAVHLQDKALGLCDALDALVADGAADPAPGLDLLRHWNDDWDPGRGRGWGKIFKPGNIGGKGGWGEGGPKEVRDEMKAFEPGIRAALFGAPERAIREALQIAHEELEHQARLRCSTGLLAYDDLQLEARNLLASNAAVRAAAHEQFRVVMVDEFQDTDPVQWDIVRLITSTDDELTPLPGRLVVVGDPKQAIYSFRGADIGTYLQAREEFGGDCLDLTTNFRTVRPVVEWINDVFKRVITKGPAQADYVDLVVRHDPASTEPTGPAVVVQSSPEDGAVPDREHESRLLADVITRAVAEKWQITEMVTGTYERHYARAATFRDVAILLPTRTGMDALLTALDDAQIPYRSGDASLVYDRPMVVGLVAAVGAIADRGAQLDIWEALKSPLFGCTDVDLVAYREAGGRWLLPWAGADVPAGRVGEALAILAQVRDAWLSPTPTDVLRALVTKCRVFETLSLSPRGDFDADCVHMVIDHATGWQDSGNVGLDAYLAWLSAATATDARTKLAEPDDRDDDAVRIMTVHAAKGLEFPIVALAGMTSTRKASLPAVGVAADGRLEFKVSGLPAPLGVGPQTSSGLEAGVQEPLRERDKAETLRLLYVACTRARDHLVVSVVGIPGGKAETRASALRGAVSEVRELRAEASEDGDVEYVTESKLAGAAGLVAPVAPPSSLPADWSETLEAIRERAAMASVVSPSGGGLGVAGAEGAGAATAGEPASTDPAAPPDPAAGATVAAPRDDDRAAGVGRAARDGRPLGRAVHGALDMVLRGEPTPEVVADACERTAIEEGIPGDVARVVARVQAAVDSELLRGALTGGRLWTELYLAAPVSAGAVTLIEGYADLVYEVTGDDGLSQLVLLDYKTDVSLDEQTLAHYREQLFAYRELLQAATGLPVAEVWILHLGEGSARPLQLA